MTDATLNEPKLAYDVNWAYQVNAAILGLRGSTSWTSVTSSSTELNYNDGAIPGTVVASKTVVVDSNKDIASFRNWTATGTTTITTLSHQSRTVNPIFRVSTTINYSDLSAAASKTLITAGTGERFKVIDILVSGGTNFNAGGDRLITIQDVAGTVLWTAMPAASLKALTNSRWGGTLTPYPATQTHLDTASQATSNIVAKYTGGATDYTSGAINLVMIMEKVA